MLSNLLKQCNVVDSSQGMRIINSNIRMDERLRELGTPVHVPEEESVELPPVEQVQEPQIDVEQIRSEALEAARQEAQQITAAAEAEAENILARARETADVLFEDQKRMGYEEGTRQKEAELEEKNAAMEASCRERQKELEDAYREKLSHMEADIVDAVIAVFDKVFRIHFEDQRQILVALVMNTLMDVDPGDKIRIRTNDGDRAVLEQHLEELQELTGQGVSIEFVHDNKLSDGQCQIETAFGVFDCSVDTELSNLMKDIRSLV